MSNSNILFFEHKGTSPFAHTLTLELEEIGQAKVALQNLKTDIDTRSKKLKELQQFLDAKLTLLQTLDERIAQKPSSRLMEKRAALTAAIDEFREEWATMQPEKVIADLTNQYDLLKQKLATHLAENSTTIPKF